MGPRRLRQRVPTADPDECRSSRSSPTASAEPENGDDNHCVELLPVDGKIKLRESDVPADILTTTPGGLRTFIRAVKAGALDHLGR
ncbi:DUF397 domain-containing protein [Streptomyces sp. Inha503]|uniref:DUF397 domain-containing protein n=1 Tax=Streptomyces sp. Inha503 TaxID=3383314 RepID=UPI0039A1C694